MEIYTVIGCGNTVHFPLFVTLSIGYKLVLHAVGLVLAFLTRNIKVDILNDYLYTVAIIIASSLVMIVVCFTIPPLSEYINWHDGVWGVLAFLLTTIYLGLTFIPKVNNMYRSK